MIGSAPTGGSNAQEALQAEVDGMTSRFNERASDGSFCGRRGLHDHHERVLRQARARLAAAIGAAPGDRP